MLRPRRIFFLFNFQFLIWRYLAIQSVHFHLHNKMSVITLIHWYIGTCYRYCECNISINILRISVYQSSISIPAFYVLVSVKVTNLQNRPLQWLEHCKNVYPRAYLPSLQGNISQQQQHLSLQKAQHYDINFCATFLIDKEVALFYSEEYFSIYYMWFFFRV